jgi:murein DD-endopeptidase MepM/ murein hydrolase activator NlpD
LNSSSLFSLRSIILAFIFISTFGSINNIAEIAEPNFEFYLSQKIVEQGDTIRVDVLCDKPIKKTTAVFAKKNIRFFVSQNENTANQKYHHYAFIGISRYLKPGNYFFKLRITLKNNIVFFKTFKIIVEDADFQFSSIKLTGKKKKILSQKGDLRKESKLFASKFTLLTPTPYFKTKFIIPSRGRVSSSFGKYRTYNGKKSSKHAGLDISNILGTTVRAANRGKVLISNSFHYHGDTILIDHGVGIFTIYNHLSSRFVRENQIVEKGQIIGHMGNSGLSTGSHLHWGFSAQNTRVNPLYWIKHSFLYDGAIIK